MVRTKVFVGNLSFQTKEAELAQEFGTAGKVISANIITRGPRSLGYGFVEMESEADADNAVKLLNKKEIGGRPINVEVAKPREEGAENADRQGSSERGGFRGRGRGRGGFRRFGGGYRGRGGFRGRGRGRGGRGRGRGGSLGGAPVAEENRTPSKTTLFVANLPFSLDDDGFAKVLKDNKLTFKGAHVVKKRNGRSKGFGFIEFEAEVDQQTALNTINGKEVEGRALVVKVALTEQPHESSANKQEGGKAEEKKEEKKEEPKK
jgi:RNA recognition motif-containing protein